MNTKIRPRKTFAGFLGRLLSVSLAVWALGVAYTPAHADVPVDQGPLIIQKPLPPNIVLMLDDSGSMDFNYMPDICYIHGTTGCYRQHATYYTDTDNDSLINAAYNQVYYNPAVTYTPPVKANGDIYSNSPGLTSAWEDGFSASNEKDLTDYTGYSSDNGYSIPLHYSVSHDADVPVEKSVGGPVSKSSCDYYKGVYENNYGANGPVTEKYKNNYCTITYYDTERSTFKFFQYATSAASGASVVHYVSANSSDCAHSPDPSMCVGVDDTSGTAAPLNVKAGQNIANWFSYYHKRILMAKSGLMNSFAGINTTFRIGYGSLHGNDRGSLGAADVEPVKAFGDGSSGTQKAKFWNWLVNEYASGGTPLRKTLESVGDYYSTAQPWQTSDSDTTELACRQSYTILTTDGFWNSTNPSVGNVDGKDGSTINGTNGQSYTYSAHEPYSDNTSNTLADVAMKYWLTDLRPSLGNEVPTSTEDIAFWQHMTTFTLGLGFTPQNIQPDGVSTGKIFDWANGGDAITGFSWPNPGRDSINNIADMVHAGVNGHGGFFSANSPQAFASGLKEALKRAAERVGTGASLAANSTQLKTGTVAYQANYYTGKWKGDLKALAVDPVTKQIATSPTWTAVDQLPAASDRSIYTYNPDAAAGSRFIQFKNADASTPPALSSSELAALGSNASERVKIVKYLRGDDSDEQKNGGPLRNRDTALGDIVDSQPIFTGAPEANQFYNESFTGSSSYPTFASDKASRTKAIYVAANDGMLHGFNAQTGKEFFAYLPAAVVTGNVKDLSNPDYGTIDLKHEYFNDGELTVADVYYSASWHSVLVGTTGRGSAKAVYALDVTNPSSINLLWERSAGDGLINSDYIGQMTGKPVIAQTSDGSWSVLMGNGYNSSKNQAALLQFAIKDGTLSVHKAGTATDNGLAAPAVWIGNLAQGVSTEAYAGDLKGHVWSFDLATDSSDGSKLFTAKDAAGNVQPITAGMLAGKDPDTGNVWVFFGTGKYLTSNDLSDLKTQSWYGLIVQSPQDPTLVSNLSSGRSALVSRSIIAETPAQAADPGDPTATPPVPATKAKLPQRVVTTTANADSIAGKSGWYINLTSPTNGDEGERMVTPNQFQGNLLLGTSRIPKATDLCNPSGRGWIMTINPFTGTNPDKNFFDVNGDGVIDSKDSVTIDGVTYPGSGVGFSSLPNNPIFVGGSMLVSFDNGTNAGLNTSGSTGGLKRVSWRELINQ